MNAEDKHKKGLYTMLSTLLSTFGQTNYYTSYSSNGVSSGPGAAFWIVYFVIVGAITIFMIAAMWKIYAKAGQEGWKAIVPIYNTIILLRIVGRPWWWLFLLLLPVVNIVFLIIIDIDLAKAFSKGGGMAVALILVPFIAYPVLGFGSATYHSSANTNSAVPPVSPSGMVPPTMPTVS